MECSLTISGGGLRSAAALGVIKYLEEKGIIITKVSGTSGGSIVALLYAYGFRQEEIVNFMKKINKWDIFRPTWKSLFSLKKLEISLREFIGNRNFKKELIVCTTCLDTGEPIYHKKGDMIRIVIASCSLVPFFMPIKINGKYHADGGYSDNLPNEPFKNLDLKNISINVNNAHGEVSLKPKILGRRLAFILMNSNIRYSVKQTDLYINIDNLETMNLFEFDKLEWAIEKGYKKAKEISINNIKR